MTEPGAPRFSSLVNTILRDFDVATELAGKPGATDWIKGEASALRSVLTWLEGYVATDLDGLRARYARTTEAEQNP